MQCICQVPSYDQRNSFELVKKASAAWDISQEIASELKRTWKGGGSEDGTGKGARDSDPLPRTAFGVRFFRVLW